MLPPTVKPKHLRVAKQISERQAERLISDLVCFGDWARTAVFAPKTSVRAILAERKMTPKQAVAFARRFFEHIPMFENLVGPDWIAAGGGVSIVRQMADGSHEDVSGPLEDGTRFSLSNYWSKFLAATRHLLRVTDTQSYVDMLSAITTGVTSIDNFIVDVAERWNLAHPDERLDLNERSSIPERLDVWFPVMTGRRYDKSGRSWQAHLRLREIRNEWDQHDKATQRAVSPSKLIEIGGDFAPGIAEVLFDLHILAGRRIPAVIIKYKYFPGFYCA
jgi:hypothetical protein